MLRTIAIVSLGVMMGTFALARPPATPPSGAWKLTIRNGQSPILMLVAFSQVDGKWVGDLVDSTAQFKKEPKFSSVAVQGENLKFNLTVDGQPFLSFDGMVTKDGKKIAGSISQGGSPLELTELRPSALKKLTDPFELMRETLNQTEEPQAVFEAATLVLGQAASKKISPEDVRGIVDRVTRVSAGQGPRWERNVTLKLANLVADQEGFAEIALTQARRAERMLTEEDDGTTRMEVLETLSRTLTKSGKAAEAKQYQTQIARLESRDYQDYMKQHADLMAGKPYAGRKAKSDRVVLVEVFANSELPPSAAFELASDAVTKAYKPTDVLVMSHHFHLRDMADPLSSLDIKDRLEAYVQSVQRGQFGLVAGKPSVSAKQTTNAASAKEILASFREKIDEELEKPSTVKVNLTATPDATGFTVKAAVSELAQPGEQVFLRFAVVEDKVRYAGGNGVRYHHHVVRAMPAGKGFALKEAKSDHSVRVNPAELRDKIAKNLDEFAKEGGEFPKSERPLGLTALKLVAFVQNDKTGEVLTAVSTDLAPKKE